MSCESERLPDLPAGRAAAVKVFRFIHEHDHAFDDGLAAVGFLNRSSWVAATLITRMNSFPTTYLGRDGDPNRRCVRSQSGYTTVLCKRCNFTFLVTRPVCLGGPSPFQAQYLQGQYLQGNGNDSLQSG